MVTNLPAEAKAKWVKVMEAKTPEEKLKALMEFLSAIPKHKGTENLVRQVRRQIAILRREIEEKKRTKRRGGGPKFFVEKEGAAQIVILGLTNSGKSTLISTLTNAKPVISDIPYTTQTPVVGMMPYEDIQFQLVEAPALIEGASEGVAWGLKTIGLARNADAILILLDASNNPISQLKVILRELSNARILITKPKGRVEIERRSSGGIQIAIMGKLVNATLDDVRLLLHSYRIYHALVKIYGEVSLSDIEDAIYENAVYKPAVIVLNKIDLIDKNSIKALINRIRGIVGTDIPVIAVSAIKGIGLKELGKILFEITGIIRVYTKQPNDDKPSDRPLILRKGATVLDAAKAIHSALYKRFKYARVWGPSAKYPGERVGGDHILMDRDILEIHVKK
ncbi:MAG TPA: TGS domain-containing protein [Desulfurococcales archaeon]|nr:TGS domain-containing protein [Desulfurococcales archaeon]